ncbi:MAG: CHAT domain-containing protein, partial [Mucilaginibacter sp.]
MHQGWGVFIITESTLKYVGLDDDLYHLINEHLQLMVRDQFWKQNDWRSRLQQMYRLLIAPIKPYLPAQGKLVISPTNLLHLVPFQALMDKNGYYLADSFDLTFTQGTSALSRMLEQQKTLISYKEKKMSGTLLNIANSGPVDNYLDTVLDEALSIEKFFDRSVQLFEGDATPETIIKTISGEFFNVIHVNCHGHFDFFDPGASGLLLAEERVLSIEEIRLKMRLKTYPLVVLSACQTNFVRPEQGEETPGIAWSFLTSGAGTVISSQWSVSSQATKELFEHFYRFRKNESLSNAEALRQAMLELRKKRAYTSTPYYWAAFQATGLP